MLSRASPRSRVYFTSGSTPPPRPSVPEGGMSTGVMLMPQPDGSSSAAAAFAARMRAAKIRMAIEITRSFMALTPFENGGWVGLRLAAERGGIAVAGDGQHGPVRAAHEGVGDGAEVAAPAAARAVAADHDQAGADLGRDVVELGPRPAGAEDAGELDAAVPVAGAGPGPRRRRPLRPSAAGG